MKRLLLTFIWMCVCVGNSNCSQVSFSPSKVVGSAGSLSLPPGNINVGGSTDAVKTIRPVFAVRGMNCFTCHGSAGSNVITDFGYGSANFQTSNFFFAGGTRTAFNDSDVSDGIGGWQTFSVNGGSIHVPAMAMPSSIFQSLFGSSALTSLVDVLQWSSPKGSSSSMTHLVTPPAGQAAVVEDSNIVITYPSAAEILALMPKAQQGQSVAVGIANPGTVMAGLAVDPAGFVRNTGVVKCMGDVVVAGPLLLKNLKLQTDADGCRLYVSQSVHIQGPITYVGAAGSNLQITSAEAILLGFSALRMGAVPNATVNSSPLRTSSGGLTTAGGPWPRFTPDLDVSYNPGKAAINGMDPTRYFDGIVREAILMGSNLNDAGDPAVVNAPAAGESVVTEPNSSENGGVGGPRIAINYSGLLLNAPHVHSRYAGVFQGVIIADVAMLARNPSSQTIEQFLYDPVFDSVDSVLPMLTTTILQVNH